MDHIVNNPMRENNQGLDIKEEHAQPDENVHMLNNEPMESYDCMENNSEIKNENIPDNDAKETDEKLEDIPGFTCENVDSEPNESPEKAKKFKCETCGKAFARSEHLKRHISCVHEGQKNHKCHLCEKAFTRSDRLKHHISSVHNDFIDDNYSSEEEHDANDSDSYYEPADDQANKMFKCNLCEKEFKRKQHLKRHLTKVHKEKSNGGIYNPWLIGDLNIFLYYCCPECDERNHTKESFVQHALEHHPMAKENLEIVGMKEEPYDDTYYDEDEGGVDGDQSHLFYASAEYGDENDSDYEEDSNVIKTKKFKCDSCDMSYTRKEHLKRHVNAVHEGKKNYNCNFCEMGFSRKDYLKRHVASIHKDQAENDNLDTKLKEEPLDDNDMDGSYQQYDNSDIKHETNSNDDPNGQEKEIKMHKCDTCGKEFKNKQHLKRHVVNVHENGNNSNVQKGPMKNENNKYICDTCGKEFNRSHHLKRHVANVHEKQRTAGNCEFCGKLFSSGATLKKHIQEIHEKTKESKCPQCEKTFSRPQHLKQHISAIHEEQRIYSCEFCGKAFRYGSNLKSHIEVVHQKLKECKCPHCENVFANTNSLKRHIETVHEGHKNYNCEFCGKSFSYSHGLKTHIKSIHEGARYQCEICQKYFTQTTSLQLHIRNVHNKEGIVYGRKRKEQQQQQQQQQQNHHQSVLHH